MRVLLRCDGGPGIGVGHVMRCLAIAEEATARGHDVSLAGVVEGELLTAALHRSGLALHPVPGRLGASGDLPDEEVWAAHDVVHVDSYTVSDDVLGRLGTGSRPVLSTMHDGHDGRRPSDIAIDPTLGAESTPRPADVAWSLRGSRWVPLRPSVRLLQRPEGAAPAERLRVVVVMGGADPAQCAPDALAAVQAAASSLAVDVQVTVVASPQTRERLDASAARSAGAVTVIDPTPELTAHLAGADLVVSAAGTTVWELCAMRVPMALVCVVDNQRTGYEQVLRRGMACGLGTPADLRGAEATAALARLLSDPAARGELAHTADEVVDGLGAWRIVSAWENVVAGARPGGGDPGRGGRGRHTAAEGSGDLARGAAGDDPKALSLRPATVADAELLLDWRNDAQTRAASRSSEPIALEEHLRWLEATVARDDRHLLVAFDEAGPVGTVRWDREAPGEWEVSITVATSRRGTGRASVLLRAGEQWLADAARRGELDELTTYLAVVHVDNTASLRLFAHAGYLPETPVTGEGFARYLKLVR